MILPLLAKLQDLKADCTVLIEVAWSLGTIQDKRAIQPLYNLHKKLQAILDPDNADRCADSSPGRNWPSGRSPDQKGSSLAHKSADGKTRRAHRHSGGAGRRNPTGGL